MLVGRQGRREERLSKQIQLEAKFPDWSLQQALEKTFADGRIRPRVARYKVASES